MREADQKLQVINDCFCLASLGAVSMTSKAIESIAEEVANRSIVSPKTFIDLCEEAVFRITKKYRERIALSETEEDYDFSLVCATPEGIFEIRPEGISEKYSDYQCFGSSNLYGEYILKQVYKPDSTLSEASKWAAYAIKQASHMDPNVGGPIQMVFIRGNAAQELTHDEILKIEQQISGQSLEFQKDLVDLVDRIVETRRSINQKVQQNLHFNLFDQREAEIWALVHPVVTEEDFTNRILALGILVDEMSFPGSSSENKKSIVSMEEWLTKTGASVEKSKLIIEKLRDIRTLRNKSFPVHPDDAGFVAVVVNWGLTFPPDWAGLFLSAVKKYLEAINGVREVLSMALATEKKGPIATVEA